MLRCRVCGEVLYKNAKAKHKYRGEYEHNNLRDCVLYLRGDIKYSQRAYESLESRFYKLKEELNDSSGTSEETS